MNHFIKSLIVFTTAISIACGNPAQAEIRTQTQYFSNGTGFFINNQGYVLTAYHVVEHCKGDIGLHGTSLVIKAKLVAHDEGRDLAILKTIPQVPVYGVGYLLADARQVAVGDAVVAAGFPNSEQTGMQFPKFTTNVGKVLSTDQFTLQNGDKPLLFSNITEQGYSGGPVLDSVGNVIGITLSGTCMGESCRAGFKQASDMPMDNFEQKRVMNENLSRHIDTNMAASIPVLVKFLRDNNVNYVESRSTKSSPENHSGQMGHAIVNVRCPSTAEELLKDRGIKRH